MPRGTWKELASCPPQDFLNCPWRHIYSLALEGAELKGLSCLVASRHASPPPPHLLLDVANIGLLLGRCKFVLVPHDTGERLECLCGCSCVSETVGATMSLSSVFCISSCGKAGNSSHIWMQWFTWWDTSGPWEHMWPCSTSLLLVSVPLLGVPSNVVAPCLVTFGCIGQGWSLLFCNQMQLLGGRRLLECFPVLLE